MMMAMDMYRIVLLWRYNMDDNMLVTQTEQSVLNSVKRLVGIMEDDKSFDIDILININSSLVTLYQLGVLEIPYTISSELDTYDEVLPGASEEIVNLVKMYLVCKTKLVFDAASLSSSHSEVLKEEIKEMAWRLKAASSIFTVTDL